MKKTKAQEIYAEAFAKPRDPRSDAYRWGVFAALRHRLEEIDYLVCPFGVGTAESDAWLAGTEEGALLARKFLETV